MLCELHPFHRELWRFHLAWDGLLIEHRALPYATSREPSLGGLFELRGFLNLTTPPTNYLRQHWTLQSPESVHGLR